MRLRFPLTPISWSILLLLLISTAGSAQDIFITPVPGAPFTAVIQVERSFLQPNGVLFALKTMREVGRDSRGRIHNEMRELQPVSNTVTPAVIRILLYDPQTRISTMLFAKQHSFTTMTVSGPPQTIPPSLFLASPTGDNLPANEFTKKEDLGVRDIEGLPAHGVRQTQTIAADNSGVGKELVVTDEYWYSDDLRINLMIQHSDPRTGTAALTVTQIDRNEPTPAFFEIPPDYKRAGLERASNR